MEHAMQPSTNVVFYNPLRFLPLPNRAEECLGALGCGGVIQHWLGLHFEAEGNYVSVALIV
jgi:hypothetical protein